MPDDRLLDRLDRLEIETPSWGYGNSGTRFHVYPWPGAAHTVEERIADAALVHEDGKPVGVLTRQDLLTFLANS